MINFLAIRVLKQPPATQNFQRTLLALHFDDELALEQLIKDPNCNSHYSIMTWAKHAAQNDSVECFKAILKLKNFTEFELIKILTIACIKGNFKRL